jgi:hypothetical protein
MFDMATSALATLQKSFKLLNQAKLLIMFQSFFKLLLTAMATNLLQDRLCKYQFTQTQNNLPTQFN